MINSMQSTIDPQISIVLPLSKSVRARELVLDALEDKKIEIEAENDDIFVLSRALCNVQLSDDSRHSTLNLKASGTALRFMTAYCAVTEGERVLSGTERLCERPIRPLVDALRRMGADIEYVEKEGFAPLRINGRKLSGGRVRLDASVSSQFASALMLISDKVDGGIEIEYDGDVASKAYIQLTNSVIERYKRGVCRSGERDWSSATVWYAAVSVIKGGEILLEGLSMDSVQPDRAVVGVFEMLGVESVETDKGVKIRGGGDVADRLVLNCENMPDAVMYIVVVSCLLGVEFEISGVANLRVKESDRIEVLMTEMKRCGYVLKYDGMGKICWFGEKCGSDDVAHIKTYNDHRMAMAMAVMGLVRDIEIENPEVVNKSYPTFWHEFDKLKR